MRRGSYRTARQTFASFETSFESFCDHLTRLGWTSSAPPHAAALYLCLACAEGHAAACRELERLHKPEMRGAVARISGHDSGVDETLQLVFAKLLTGENPRILTYRGAGPLGRWLRVVSTRIALDQRRAARRAARLEAAFSEQRDLVLPAPSSLESRLFHHRHGKVVQEALQHSLASLKVEQRRILRLSLAQGLSIDAIGELYGIHRSAAARRLARCRHLVLERVRDFLKEKLGELDEAEFSSLVQTLHGELDENLSGLLATTPPGRFGAAKP